MTGADIVELVKAVGVPAVVLGGVLLWLGKSFLPSVLDQMRTQHAEDRTAWERDSAEARKAFTEALAALTSAFEGKPCWWQQPGKATPNATLQEVRQP